MSAKKKVHLWIDGRTVAAYIRPLPEGGIEALKCGHCKCLPEHWVPIVDIIQYGLFVDSQCYTVVICSRCQKETAVSYTTGD